MDFNLADFLYLGGVALIIGIVQMFKQWVLDTRYYPVIAVAAGLLINVSIGLSLGQDLVSSVFMGLLAGLAASGLYSAGSTFREGTAAIKPGATSPPPPPPIAPSGGVAV